MKKGSAPGIGTIAKIIFIVLVLFIISSILNGLYGQTFEDGIKKLLGQKTESEITHEQNIQIKKAFENLEKQIKKCQDSKDKNCGCLVDLNKFTNNYKIEFTDKETKLINIKNLRDKGLQMASFDKKINCYWNKKLEQEDFTTIIFNPEPIIYLKTIFNKDGKFIHNFNIFKDNQGKLCWLTSKVNENIIKDIKECQ